MGELRGARSLASETSRAVRDARTRSRSPEGGRRGPRAKRDPIYAELLDRRDQNAERLREARERQYFHDAEEFLGTKSPQSRPSPGSGRSPGRPRSSPGVRALPAPGDPSRDSSSSSDDDEGDDARGGGRRRAARRFARRSVANSRRRVDLSLGRRARRRIARLAARRPEPPVRVPSPRDAVVPRLDTGSTTTTATRLRSGATSRTRLRRRARARRRPASALREDHHHVRSPSIVHVESSDGTRAQQARDGTRVASPGAHGVGGDANGGHPLAGEPGLRKHWDDPLRAAAEQAAAKVASEEGIAATSETARAAARRAAAAAARLVDAELLSSDGDSPEGRSLRSRAKRAYLGDVAAALRDPVGFAALPPDRFNVDVREDRPRGLESGDEGENIDDGEGFDDDEYGDFARELAVVDAADARAPSRPGSRFEASRFEASRFEASRPASVLTSPSRRRRPRVTSASASSVRRESRRSSSSSAPPPPSDDPYSNRPIARGRFLRSGHGGAGMARGRSVAAMEEFSNPEHAARLRRSLETSAGPALAAARAEQARAAARVGRARARARREAEAAAKAEAAARAARRSVRRKPPVFAAPAPRFDAPGSARESIDDASLVSEARRRLDAKLHRDGNRHLSSSRAPRRPLSARSRPLVRISTSTCPLRATGARSSARRRRPCTRRSRARTARTTPPRDSRRRTDARCWNPRRCPCDFDRATRRRRPGRRVTTPGTRRGGIRIRAQKGNRPRGNTVCSSCARRSRPSSTGPEVER